LRILSYEIAVFFCPLGILMNIVVTLTARGHPRLYVVQILSASSLVVNVGSFNTADIATWIA
jgi:hypothetical protein